MDVSGYKANKDYYAPSRVTDLTVSGYDTSVRTVTLTWTAPGDDLSSGTGRCQSYCKIIPNFNIVLSTNSVISIKSLE